MKRDNNIKKYIHRFPDMWSGYFDSPTSMMKFEVFLSDDENTSCLVSTFDSICILYCLWTWPSERGKGGAQTLIREVGETNKPLPTFARYKNNEEDIAMVFKKGGYEVIYIGGDGFVIVNYKG